MAFGGRRRRVLLAALGVVVAVIAAVIVLRGSGDDHPYDEPVAASTMPDFDTRGPLADDKDVIEAAADVWREGDSNRAETKPEGPIELLWAGKVDAEAVDGLVTDKDTPDKVRVVVLRSYNEIATFADRQVDSDRAFDSIGIEDKGNYSAVAHRIPGNLVLTADSFPRSYDAVDEGGAPLRVRADDGLISSTREDIALRLESTTTPRFGLKSEPGIFVGGKVVRFAEGDLDRVWTMLNSVHVAEAVRAGVHEVLKVSTGLLALPKVDVLRQSEAPGGSSLLVLTGTGSGVAGGHSTRQAVAVGYTDDENQPLQVASLGRLDGAGSWVGLGWISREGAVPYLVVAGGDGAEEVQVYVGRQSERFGPPVGIVVPDIEKDGELPPKVVAGFTKNGSVVPTLKVADGGR